MINWTPKNARFMNISLPIVGLIIGVIGYYLFNIVKYLNFGVNLSAVIMVMYFLFITGGLHFDGLLDASDGYFSRKDIPTRLKIMSDSGVGAFAVITAVCQILIRFGLFSQIFINRDFNPIMIIFIPIVSRILVAYMKCTFPQAKKESLSNMYNSNSAFNIWILALFFSVTLYLLWHFAGYMGTLIALAGVLYCVFYYFSTKKHFGGITGDLLGAFTELGETLMWFVAIF